MNSCFSFFFKWKLLQTVCPSRLIWNRTSQVLFIEIVLAKTNATISKGCLLSNTKIWQQQKVSHAVWTSYSNVNTPKKSFEITSYAGWSDKSYVSFCFKVRKFLINIFQRNIQIRRPEYVCLFVCVRIFLLYRSIDLHQSRKRAKSNVLWIWVKWNAQNRADFVGRTHFKWWYRFVLRSQILNWRIWYFRWELFTWESSNKTSLYRKYA